MQNCSLTHPTYRAKAGHHDTTVHEKVAPAIVQEEIVRKRHEEATTAIDREVHQDHYHTSIQPVKDREVLPEQHTHQMAPVEVRELHHGDESTIRARLEQEAAQFKSTRVEGAVQETHSVAPTIAGEHVHHHVHEVSVHDHHSNKDVINHILSDHPTSRSKGDYPTISRAHHRPYPRGSL